MSRLAEDSHFEIENLMQEHVCNMLLWFLRTELLAGQKRKFRSTLFAEIKRACCKRALA